MSEKSSVIELYQGRGFQIWSDEDEDGQVITVSMFNRMTFNLDKDDFQELCNAIIIAKQVLKDTDSRR